MHVILVLNDNLYVYQDILRIHDFILCYLYDIDLARNNYLSHERTDLFISHFKYIY